MPDATSRQPAPPERGAPGSFVAIDLDGLVTDTVIDFNLYIPVGREHYILFRAPQLEFGVQQRNRLLENGVRTLFIRADERGTYARYLEHNLGAVLNNPAVPEPKKANLLYSVSRAVIRDAFEDPRAQAVVPRTRKVAEETVDFVLKSDRALAQLASIMATDYYTYTHSINVAVFAVALASRAGVSRDDIAELATGALLHDVGKSQLPKQILTRTGPLSDEEMTLVRQHVLLGEQMLAGHPLSELTLKPVGQHHEKLDGSGYPRGLHADDIHLFGRITAIADCFDAMTSNRSYQRAMSGFEALHRLKTVLNDQFDQRLLVHFIRMLRASTDAAHPLKSA